MNWRMALLFVREILLNEIYATRLARDDHESGLTTDDVLDEWILTNSDSARP
jgi:hypothetical protein